jgi:photosystem II stability/assembly factor-like uncharacterized protein
VRSRSVRGPAVVGATRSRQVLAAGIGLVALLAVFYAALVVREEPVAPGELRPMAGPDSLTGHVRGLAVDPADGTLYAAGRYGVFRVPAQGDASRIANRYQDTTGFVVTSSGDFLASGHPDGREGLADDLGLIRSSDQGRTWTPLSLAGDADFRTLEYKHGRVFGYEANSAQLMVSRDGRAWDRLAVIPVADFAVDPADDTAMVATTDQGLASSQDRGRTFHAVPAPPDPYLLSWPAANALFAATTDGTLHLSADGGETWERRGQLDGEPHALTAVDATTVYTATRTGIQVSTDGGRTFSRRYPR